MDTYTATKNRILELCGQYNITINKLATLAALPPSSIKNILYGKSTNPLEDDPHNEGGRRIQQYWDQQN